MINQAACLFCLNDSWRRLGWIDVAIALDERFACVDMPDLDFREDPPSQLGQFMTAHNMQLAHHFRDVAPDRPCF